MYKKGATCIGGKKGRVVDISFLIWTIFWLACGLCVYLDWFQPYSTVLD